MLLYGALKRHDNALIGKFTTPKVARWLAAQDHLAGAVKKYQITGDSGGTLTGYPVVVDVKAYRGQAIQTEELSDSGEHVFGWAAIESEPSDMPSQTAQTTCRDSENCHWPLGR
jgi:hypothetical protein